MERRGEPRGAYTRQARAAFARAPPKCRSPLGFAYSGGVTSVHGDRCAGNITRLVAHEEGHSMCDVGRFRQALQC